MTLEMLNTIYDIIGNESINAQIEMDDMIQSYMDSASVETMREVCGETILQDEEFKKYFRSKLPELWHVISMDLDERWNDLADYRRRCDDVLEYLKTYDFT